MGGRGPSGDEDGGEHRDELGPVAPAPLLPEHRQNPWPEYRRLQADHPVHRMAEGWWQISRYDDCWSILRNRAFSSQPDRLRADSPLSAPTEGGSPAHLVFRPGSKVLLFLDPPDHTRLRSLVSRAFTARTVADLRPRIEWMVDTLLDEVVERGSFEVMGDLAYPLPAWVICELLGVPTSDRDQFRQWSSDVSRLLDGGLDEATTQRSVASAMELIGYFVTLIEERRADLGPDLLSRLIAAEQDHDRLDAEELLTTTILLFVAGHETTMNLIGNGLLALLEHRSQWDRLKANPQLTPAAIEEMLRFAGPVQLVPRIATERVELRGHTFEPGDGLTLFLAAANRDPARFHDPDHFDVGRSDNTHLALSSGAHHCLGAPLARLEADVVFRALTARFGDLELTLAPDEVRYRDHAILRGVETLPVRSRVLAASS